MGSLRGLSAALDNFGFSRSGRLRTEINRRYARLTREQRSSAQGFLSFSQFGEDAFVHWQLKDSPFSNVPGTYLDIGSGDPVRGSNTYAFYRRGWTGVLVDPIERNVEEAVLLRPRDRVKRACIGSSVGVVEFFELDSYEYSTADKERIQQLREGGDVPRATYEVPMTTVADLGMDMTPDAPTLLSIDVEGGETEVLDGIDWSLVCPALIVIEEWDGPLGKHTPLMERLDGYGYDLAGVVGYSSIYRHRLFPH